MGMLETDLITDDERGRRIEAQQIGAEATTHLTRVLLQFSEKSESKPVS